MLDVLEAGVEALRSNSGNLVPHGVRMISPQEFRAGLTASSLSTSDLSNALSVTRETVDQWLNGQAAIPAWVPVTMRVIALLAPSARRKLQNGAAHHTKTETETAKRCHPFARIEEL
jgi:hypothetical protein